MASGIIFANPTLEESFRATVHNTQLEIGGWFIVTYNDPPGWPGRFSYRAFKKALAIDWHSPAFIIAFVLIPNEAKNAKTTYSMWDLDKAQAAAQATADVYGQTRHVSLLHFHTHPNNIGRPSQNDIAFAAANCSRYRRYAEFCIVTPTPMRVWPFELRWGAANSPDKDGRGAERDVYWSWRESRLRGLLEARP
jgi:hypothetical protein